jgi:hypothetical protein
MLHKSIAFRHGHQQGANQDDTQTLYYPSIIASLSFFFFACIEDREKEKILTRNKEVRNQSKMNEHKYSLIYVGVKRKERERSSNLSSYVETIIGNQDVEDRPIYNSLADYFIICLKDDLFIFVKIHQSLKHELIDYQHG